MFFKKRYEQKARLGNGTFGQVLKVLDKKDNKFCALKFIIPKNNENVNDLIKECKKEIDIMKKIKSEYVVKLIEHFYDETYQGYCIVMELCNSDLRKLLNEYKQK